MKLQVNNSGAWKNVLDFSINDLGRVKSAASELGDFSERAGDRIGWRVLDSQGTSVLQWDCKRGWHTPAWMLGHEIVP